MALVREVFKKKEHIQFLTDAGYDPEQGINQKNSYTESLIIHDIITEYRVDMAKILFEQKIDLDEIDKCQEGTRYGRTPLCSAIAKRSDEMALLLIKRGADKEKCQESESGRGLSPLMVAAMLGNKKILIALLEAGADINQENLLTNSSDKYKTALMYVIKSSNEYIANFMPSFLIKKGARLNNSQEVGIFSLCSSQQATKIIAEMWKMKQRVLETSKQLTNLIPNNSSTAKIICSYMPGFLFVSPEEYEAVFRREKNRSKELESLTQASAAQRALLPMFSDSTLPKYVKSEKETAIQTLSITKTWASIVGSKSSSGAVATGVSPKKSSPARSPSPK